MTGAHVGDIFQPWSSLLQSLSFFQDGDGVHAELGVDPGVGLGVHCSLLLLSSLLLPGEGDHAGEGDHC